MFDKLAVHSDDASRKWTENSNGPSYDDDYSGDEINPTVSL